MEDRNDKVRRSLSELPKKFFHTFFHFFQQKRLCELVLSKRWEYIWTSIPKLLFDDGNELPMDFVNIVDRSLRLRGSFDVTSFSLYCYQFQFFRVDVDIMSKIEGWLSGVMGLNVQDVELSLLGFSPLTFPFGFVNCRTLTSLFIFVGGITLEFPSLVCFFNLKKLKLARVILPDEHSTQKLFSSCLLLEDFELLDQCHWENVNAVSLVSPLRLQNFTMIEDVDEQPLEEVHINFYSPENGPMPVINHFLKLLRYTTDVPNLKLRNALCLLDIQEVLIQVPVFNGLRHLELYYDISNLSNKGLLMQQGLTSEFIIEKGIKILSDPIEDNILNPLPPCFLYCLHFIYVYIKKGDVKDLMGVKVLLENAMPLVEMAIEFSKFVNKDVRNKFLR
ncbi:hypothetical protein K1719_044422 [Acacia pycnantha]|nr:hypothetical protein K1719_044422 [Acacia pycnantha]